MPIGWQLVTLVSSERRPIEAGGSRGAPPTAHPTGAPSPLPRAAPPDIVVSAGISYDRALLPPGFFERGVSAADRMMWDVEFSIAVAERDEAQVQALAQGQLDHIGEVAKGLNAKLSGVGQFTAVRRRSSVVREADEARQFMNHVLSRVAPYSR